MLCFVPAVSEQFVSAPDETPAGRWRALILLAFVLFFSMSTWFSASAVVPQLRQEWSLTNTSVAWLTIAVQVGFVLGALLSSVVNLADLISPRYVIMFSAIGAGVANLLITWTDKASIGISLRLMTGFFLAGVYPPAFKFMSTWFRRGRGMALGTLAGALIIGNSVPHLINVLGGLDWQVVLWATSVLTILGGLIAGLAVQEGPFPFPSATFNPREAGRVLRNRGVRLASFGYFGHMWELFAAYAWFLFFFTAHLQEKGKPTDTLPALVTFGFIAIGGIGCWIAGITADRVGRTTTTAVMLTVSGACSAIIGFLLSSPTWLVLTVALVWGLALVGDSPQFSTMVTELADQSYVGTALTVQLALGFALTAVSIWILPFIVEHVGWRWAFAFLTPGPVFGVISMLRLKNSPFASSIAGGRG